ncbi:hypothetical protein ACJIZ3_025167 [Penstemon smallii]|uniref:Transmembrane protein n=1 Tax=Penstemon smallii TaxID=265156 RepID=A0ABD3TTY5_9LAMI
MAADNNYALVTILAFNLLISISDLSTSRAEILLHENQAITSPEVTLQMDGIENKGEFNIHSRTRMDLEINRDYPVSGPNNRHTPTPQVKD